MMKKMQTIVTAVLIVGACSTFSASATPPNDVIDYCKGENTKVGIETMTAGIEKATGQKVDWTVPGMSGQLTKLKIVYNQQCLLGYEHKKAGVENSTDDLMMQYRSMLITAKTPAQKAKATGFKSSADAYNRGYNFTSKM